MSSHSLNNASNRVTIMDWHKKVVEANKLEQEAKQWAEVLAAAKTNPVLQEMLDQVLTYHALIASK